MASKDSASLLLRARIDTKKSEQEIRKQVNEISKKLEKHPIKLRAKLDVNKSLSFIRKQVDEISKKLATHPVKLKVKLEVFLKDIQPQLKDLSKRLEKYPLKLRVRIDTYGSAWDIKKQLKEIYKTVDDFNKKYGEQLKRMQERTQKAGKQFSSAISGSVPTGGLLAGFDIKQYAKQLKEAERMMKSAFGEGLFSSIELKDAEGNLQGFIAQLQKANGVVQRIRYAWDNKREMFQIIDRQTATQTEKNVKRAIDSLKELEREILKLGKNGAQFWGKYNDLIRQGSRGLLTPDEVNVFKRQIKDEQILQQQIIKENRLLNEQKKLIEDIKKGRAEAHSKRTQPYEELMGRARKAETSEDYKALRLELQKINELERKRQDRLKEMLQVTKGRLELMRELKKLEAKAPTEDNYSRLKKRYVEEVKLVLQQVKSYEELAKVRNSINKLKDDQWLDNNQKKARKFLEDLRAVGEQLRYHGYDMTRFDETLRKLSEGQKGYLNTKDIELQLDAYTRLLKRKKNEIRNAEKEIRLGENITSIVEAKFGSKGMSLLQDMIKEKDIQGIQEFISKIYGAKVAAVSLKNDGVDPTGRAVTKLITTFDSAGKTARRVQLTMAEGTNILRQASEEMVYNANRNLGVMEQLRIAMARVPVWMTAMTAFYGSINAVQAMTEQILMLDEALTELKRVADDHISIDTLFENAVQLSNELGNNIHEVMKSLAEFARTFGDFNERQLLAITKTATLMANVSDLTPQEATESLVGTMNAFNITAEESIRIVDALNETDNNYAISTKQLAEALSKSSATAKTFGVTLEENIGHITAIGAVTMESGQIIGNALKTIYSRITTMKDAKMALEGIGIAITEIGENGQETIRPVSNILEDLASRWDTLTEAQRQDIAVKVAGRYQLSRFLALMNNYQMALDATETALTSEGSAMRENAEYMKSYEARLNKLKNSFTELSTAFGEAILSDSMLLVIEGLTSMAKAAAQFIESFGVLPSLFAVLSFGAARFGALQKPVELLVEGFDRFGDALKKTTAQTSGIRGAFTGISAGFGALATTIGTATKALGGFRIAWKAMLAETVIGFAFVGLGIAIEKLVGYFAEQKRLQEEINKTNEQMVQSYRKHAGSIDSLIDKYEQLHNKQNRTAGEQKEYERVVKEISNILPTAVEYTDANGKAHLKSANAIREEAEAVAQLSQEQAKLQNLNYTKNIQEQIKVLEEASEKIKKLEKEQARLRESHGKPITIPNTYGTGVISDNTNQVLRDNTKAIQENKIEVMRAEAEKTNAIKKTIKVIQEQSIAYLESQGKLANMGDAQQAAIEKFIQSNDEMLRKSNNFKETTDQLFKLGTSVGEVFAEAFKKMSTGLDEGSPKLEEVKEHLNTIASILPDDFFVLDKNRSIETVTQQLRNIISVSNQIAQGSTDWNGLVGALQSSGLTAEQASSFIARLAREHDNAKLRAQAQAQGIEELRGSIESLKKTIEEVDITKALFGYSSADLKSIQSHVQLLQILKQEYGENATKTKEWAYSIGTLSDYLGVSKSEIASNLNYYNLVIDALSKVTVETNKYGKATLDMSQLSARQKQILEEFAATARNKGLWLDLLTKETSELVQSQEKVPASTSNAKQALEGLNNISFSGVKNQFNDVSSKADEVKGKVLNLKEELALNNLITSPAINSIVSGYGLVGKEAETAKTKLEGFKQEAQSPVGTTTFDQVNNSMSGLTQSLDGATAKMVEANNNLMNFNTQLTSTTQKAGAQVNNFNSIANSINQIGNVATTIKSKLDALAQSLTKISNIGNLVRNTLNGLSGIANKLSASFNQIISLAKSISTVLNNMATNARAYTNTLNATIASSIRSANVSRQNANAKKVEASAFAQSASQIKAMINSYNSMGSASISALTKIKNALNQQRQAITQLYQTFSQASSSISKTFTNMASIVRSRTNNMISSHNSQRSAINSLASAARSAKSAIESLNTSARSAMTSLNNYIAKARTARAAGASVPAVPRASANSLFSPLNTISSGENSTANTVVALSGEISSSVVSGSDGGASGIIRPEGGVNFDGQYVFHALADLPEKVTADLEERQMTVYEGLIRQKETILQRMIKLNADYRDILKSILYWENKKLEVAQRELEQTIKRNDWVNNRLKQLNQLKNHTKAQREEYNKLQQEYDQNISKIASLRAETEALINSIQEHSKEIFSDFIQEIVSNYDKAIEVIKSKIDDLDFKTEVLTLTQPDNIKDLLNTQIEKAKELQEQLSQEANKVADLTEQYELAKKRYGADSQQAKTVEEALNNAREAYEEAVLAVLRTEKEIKDTRAKIADEGIKQLQEYYKNMKSMTVDAIEEEKKALQKAHDEKMKMYDKELDKINSIYDERLKAMEREKDEAKYQEELDEKNAKRAELLNRISLLSRDNSLEGRKKLSELKKELADLEKEIADFQKERQEELLKQAIEDQKQQQIDAINQQKEHEKESLDSRLEELDAGKEAISKKYDDILNNEKYWADMRNEYIKGSFDLLGQELNKMKESLDLMNQGIFDGLTDSFSSFSEEVKKKIAELNELVIDNLIFNSGGIISSHEQIKGSDQYDFTDGIPRPAPSISTPEHPDPPKGSNMFRLLMPNGEYIDTAVGTTLYRLLKEGGQVVSVPEGLKVTKGMTRFVSPTGQFVDTAVSKTMLELLKKGYLKVAQFESGGYTGSWIGNDGKLGILHEKEMVLNKRQTEDILNTAKIVERLKDFIPNIGIPNVANKLAATGNMNVTNEYHLTLNIDNMNGTKEDAKTVVKEIIKGLRKMGK